VAAFKFFETGLFKEIPSDGSLRETRHLDVGSRRRLRSTGNDNVPKIIIINAMNLFF